MVGEQCVKGDDKAAEDLVYMQFLQGCDEPCNAAGHKQHLKYGKKSQGCVRAAGKGISDGIKRLYHHGMCPGVVIAVRHHM